MWLASAVPFLNIFRGAELVQDFHDVFWSRGRTQSPEVFRWSRWIAGWAARLICCVEFGGAVRWTDPATRLVLSILHCWSEVGQILEVINLAACCGVFLFRGWNFVSQQGSTVRIVETVGLGSLGHPTQRWRWEWDRDGGDGCWPWGWEYGCGHFASVRHRLDPLARIRHAWSQTHADNRTHVHDGGVAPRGHAR